MEESQQDQLNGILEQSKAAGLRRTKALVVLVETLNNEVRRAIRASTGTQAKESLVAIKPTSMK